MQMMLELYVVELSMELLLQDLGKLLTKLLAAQASEPLAHIVVQLTCTATLLDNAALLELKF
jgi:hypothetical protein